MSRRRTGQGASRLRVSYMESAPFRVFLNSIFNKFLVHLSPPFFNQLLKVYYSSEDIFDCTCLELPSDFRSQIDPAIEHTWTNALTHSLLSSYGQDFSDLYHDPNLHPLQEQTLIIFKPRPHNWLKNRVYIDLMCQFSVLIAWNVIEIDVGLEIVPVARHSWIIHIHGEKAFPWMCASV